LRGRCWSACRGRDRPRARGRRGRDGDRVVSPEQSIERTLVVLKPDAVQRGISGEILSRFERRGLRIAALRLLRVARAMAEKHYAVHKGKFFYDDLVNVISSSPVVAMVLEGPTAIGVVR